MDEDAKKNIFKYYQVGGQFAWMDGRLLYHMIKKYKPSNIIEIGCGSSTLLMINTIKNMVCERK